MPRYGVDETPADLNCELRVVPGDGNVRVRLGGCRFAVDERITLPALRAARATVAQFRECFQHDWSMEREADIMKDAQQKIATGLLPLAAVAGVRNLRKYIDRLAVDGQECVARKFAPGLLTAIRFHLAAFWLSEFTGARCVPDCRVGNINRAPYLLSDYVAKELPAHETAVEEKLDRLKVGDELQRVHHSRVLMFNFLTVLTDICPENVREADDGRLQFVDWDYAFKSALVGAPLPAFFEPMMLERVRTFSFDSLATNVGSWLTPREIGLLVVRGSILVCAAEQAANR